MATGWAPALCAALAAAAPESGWFEEPPAPGPHVGLEPSALQAVESFAPRQPIVGTYLFYWYDVYSGAHVTYADGGDACQDHPPTWDDYSYHSTRWWRHELADIADAVSDGSKSFAALNGSLTP